MTIEDEANYYANCLNPSVAKSDGIAVVVSNLRDMWQQANTASDRLRILICYEGEQVRGPFETAAATRRVDRQWQAAIVRGRGYNANRGASLTSDVGNAPAFYKQVQIYRDAIRAITATSVETPLDYKGIEPMNLGSLVLDGYIVKWSTAVDLTAFNPLTPQNAPI